MQRLLTGKTRLPEFGGEWETKRIGDLLTYERPDRYIVQHDEYVERGDAPVLTANKSFVLGYTNETFGVCVDFPVIIFDDFTVDCKYVTFPFKVKSSAIKLLRSKNGVDLRYMFERMQLIDFPVSDHRRYYISDYQNVKIALPTYDEQVSIAEALSDMDELIESLESLIAKKRVVKTAAMQRLLTGKTRLPGFSGTWERTALGKISDIKNGSTPSTEISTYWNGRIPWCTPTDITDTPGKYLFATERNITQEGLASCTASLLPVGALLLCSRATIGEIKIAGSQVCTNQGFKSLVCKDEVSNEFIYYLLVTLKSKLIERAIGSTFLEIGKHEVASLEVNLPPLDEQRAVAAILSGMDTEIATLEQRCEKARAIKRGMMQQLLTGKIRLAESVVVTGDEGPTT